MIRKCGLETTEIKSDQIRSNQIDELKQISLLYMLYIYRVIHNCVRIYYLFQLFTNSISIYTDNTCNINIYTYIY